MAPRPPGNERFKRQQAKRAVPFPKVGKLFASGRGLFIAKSVAEDPKILHSSEPREMLGYGAEILSDEGIDDFFDFLPERTAFDAVPF